MDGFRLSPKGALCAFLMLFFAPVGVFGQQASVSDGAAFPPDIQKRIDAVLNAYSGLKSQIQTPDEVRRQYAEQSLEFDIAPKHPEPGQAVRIGAVSYLADLASARISWYLNDQLAKSGVGEYSFEFAAGAAGSTSVVNVVVLTKDGQRLARRLVFRPAQVDLLWEADSHTPPFYKGRSLLAPEGAVKVVAVPTVGSLAPGELHYTWKENGRAVGPASGMGKSVFYTRGPKPFGSLDVEVEVTSPGGSYTAVKKLEVEVASPRIVFYRKNPLSGVFYGTAMVGAHDLAGKELRIQAEPYFFSRDGTVYEWYMNNKRVSETGNSLVVRNETEESGVSQIQMVARNYTRTFQIDDRSLLLNFGGGSAGNVFR